MSAEGSHSSQRYRMCDQEQVTVGHSDQHAGLGAQPASVPALQLRVPHLCAYVAGEMARRWRLLQALQDRNETLFYKASLSN